MSAPFQPDYTLPSGDQPTTHARIAHANNWITGGTITASGTATGYDASAADNSLTYERWKPDSNPGTWENDFGSDQVTDYCLIAGHTLGTDGAGLRIQYEAASHTNLLLRSEEMDNASWAKSDTSVSANAVTAPDGNTTADTVTADATTAFHSIKQNVTKAASAIEYTFSVFVKAAGYTTGRIRISDTEGGGAVGSFADFDLTAETMSAVGDVGAGFTSTSAGIEGIGNSWYRIWITGTTNTATNIRCLIYPNQGSSSYLGDGTSGLHVWGAHLETAGAVGSYIATTTTSASDTWHDLLILSPEDDEPIFAIYEPLAERSLRIMVTGPTEPEVAVVKFGVAMQMTQAIYGGHSPLKTARRPVMRSNRTTTGAWAGRSKISMGFESSFDWAHLKAAWVRSTFLPFQKAIETEPFGIAWRAGTFSEAAYCWVSDIPTPTNMGIKDYMSVSVNVEALGHE